MGWLIKCTDIHCGQQTWAGNIVDLITRHRDKAGWFLCSCGKHGYIEKSFPLQEVGGIWAPFLRGIISLGDAGNTYQPFVFLVSYQPAGDVKAVWFSYYKDLRSSGGRLKLGYGPGGPPVLNHSSILDLLAQLVQAKCITSGEVIDAIGLGPTSDIALDPTPTAR